MGLEPVACQVCKTVLGCWKSDSLLLFLWIQVVTEGRLMLDFTFDDLMRIRSWHFATRQHRELIPRSVIAMQVSQGHMQAVTLKW